MSKIKDIFLNLEKNCDKFEHYFDLYEKWFVQFRHRSPKILEIGVQYGGSAEMWYKYFGKGTQIIGVDINPKTSNTEYLKILVGDQGRDEFWEEQFIKKNVDNFDIIIDDGSHENQHQILTLVKTFNLLKDGGIYWCEDTHTSYYENVKVRDGGYKNSKSFIEYTKNLIDVINDHHTYHAIGIGKTPDSAHIDNRIVSIFEKIQGIHFYDSVVVIEKGPRLQFKRVTLKR